MIDPRDIPAGFDRIAAEAEPLLIRLGRAAPGAELDIVRNEITHLLDGAGLRWSDLAARVAAPSMAAAPSGYRPPPMPPPMPPVLPRIGPILNETSVLTNEELLAGNFGYRSARVVDGPHPTEE